MIYSHYHHRKPIKGRYSFTLHERMCADILDSYIVNSNIWSDLCMRVLVSLFTIWDQSDNIKDFLSG